MRPIVYGSKPGDLPASLLAGMEGEICAVLGITNLRHRSALVELSQQKILPKDVVEAAYRVVARNWQVCRAQRVTGSRENWRWRVPQFAISDRNSSPEVRLERALVAACERAGRQTWSNQVPVASGVAGSSRERRRAIDLVHQKGPDWFEFIELKVASDTPLYAAVEITAYVCVWLVSREGSDSKSSALLKAARIDAVVLAPESYYARYYLKPIEFLFHQGLKGLGKRFGLEFSFSFQSFSDVLMRHPFDDKKLLTLLDRRAVV